MPPYCKHRLALVADPSQLTFMSSYSIVLAPLAGLMAVDFFIVKKGKYDVYELYKPDGIYRYFGGWNWRSYTALLVAVALNLPGMINAIQPTVEIGNIYYLYMLSNVTGVSRSRVGCKQTHRSTTLIPTRISSQSHCIWCSTGSSPPTTAWSKSPSTMWRSITRRTVPRPSRAPPGDTTRRRRTTRWIRGWFRRARRTLRTLEEYSVAENKRLSLSRRAAVGCYGGNVGARGGARSVGVVHYAIASNLSRSLDAGGIS